MRDKGARVRAWRAGGAGGAGGARTHLLPARSADTTTCVFIGCSCLDDNVCASNHLFHGYCGVLQFQRCAELLQSSKAANVSSESSDGCDGSDSGR